MIGPFSGTHPNKFSILALILPFAGTRTNSTIFLYSHWFDPFSVLTRTGFGYWQRFYFFLVLTPILSFLGTHIDWTVFRYSPEQVLETRMDSTFSSYSLGFCHFLVLTLIGPFSRTHPNSFSILAWILLFPGTHPDSAIFRYSH